MTPKISPTLLRELADQWEPEFPISPDFVSALRAAADRLDELEAAVVKYDADIQAIYAPAFVETLRLREKLAEVECRGVHHIEREVALRKELSEAKADAENWKYSFRQCESTASDQRAILRQRNAKLREAMDEAANAIEIGADFVELSRSTGIALGLENRKVLDNLAKRARAAIKADGEET